MAVRTSALFSVGGLLLALAGGALRAAEPNPFFAMDTAARGKPADVAALLKELGYAGLGGQIGDGTMAIVLENAGLKFYNGYTTAALHADHPAPDNTLCGKIDGMKKHITSGSVAQSIGRWRTELSAAQIELCESRFGEALREFGYCE